MFEDEVIMKTQQIQEVVLVSACLVGLPTRYDGKVKTSAECLRQLQDRIWVPVCPEQLGGLSTPRPPAKLDNGDGKALLCGQLRLVNKEGADVTDNFIRGAKIVEKIAKDLGVKKIFLKARSPSCGVSGTIGVTAAYLEKRGYELYEF